MAFPGDRAVYQFPRGVEADFESVVMPQGEIVIFMDPDDINNWEIRVGDGETVGGIGFATKAYVDQMTEGSGVAAGTDILAAAGVDTVQRSWPATVFAQKANVNNAALTGVPTAPTAIEGTATTQIATTAFVDNGFKRKGSTSSDNAEVNFPVGHQLVANNNGTGTNRNSTPGATLRLDNANTLDYQLGGVGTALAGTWRSRGRILTGAAENFTMFERVA
jgi:hypothetical protein